MKVLSLFDGISCGLLALQRAGVQVDAYYASEVDKSAIKCTSTHNPSIIQIGDVSKVSFKDGVLTTEKGVFKTDIDLVIGGSPCQSFSAAGDGSGFGGKSGLYWEYSRVLKEVQAYNPGILFLLENVVMRQQWQDVITKDLSVNPILIDSALVSHQRRKRLYWTNIPDVDQPKDLQLSLDKYFDPYGHGPIMRSAQIVGRRLNKDGKREDHNTDIPVKQYLEFRKADKVNTLTTVLKDNVLTCIYPECDDRVVNGRIPMDILGEQGHGWRYLTPEEYEVFQTIPKGYTQILPKTQRYKAVGNAWTVDVIAHIFKGLK